MPSYHYGKIRYQQPIDEMAVGTRNQSLIRQKTVTEAYLIDAVSFTDAEARLFAHVADNTPDFEVTHLPKYPLSDVFRFDTGEYWFKCKIVYLTEHERTGREKKIKNTMLVNAETNKQAYERIQESLKTMLMSFEVKDIVQTDILEVVDYNDDSKNPDEANQPDDQSDE